MVKVYTIFKNKTSLQETACGFSVAPVIDSLKLPHTILLVSGWQRLPAMVCAALYQKNSVL